jgi:hypothetical protein
MAEEENGHRHCLLDLYREKFGDHIPMRAPCSIPGLALRCRR